VLALHDRQRRLAGPESVHAHLTGQLRQARRHLGLDFGGGQGQQEAALQRAGAFERGGHDRASD
jgi:hypothetical protein